MACVVVGRHRVFKGAKHGNLRGFDQPCVALVFTYLSVLQRDDEIELYVYTPFITNTR